LEGWWTRERTDFDDIWSAFFVGRDRGNGYCLAEAVDEVIGERVYLLEVAIELRGHGAFGTVDIRPGSGVCVSSRSYKVFCQR
jgi:hypothetical protein